MRTSGSARRDGTRDPRGAPRRRLALGLVKRATTAADFRYTRTLAAPTSGPVSFEPDGAMYGHARVRLPGPADPRRRRHQVPWRTEPILPAVSSQPVAARRARPPRRNRVGRRGPRRRPSRDRSDRARDPGRDLRRSRRRSPGSTNGAEGSYATLSTTQIYAVRGAVDARSTTAVFPADRLPLPPGSRGGRLRRSRAPVSRREPSQTPLEPVAATSRRSERGQATVVRLDLGYPNVPVDAVRIESTTPSYVRAVRVEGSNDGTSFIPLAQGRIARFPGSSSHRRDRSAPPLPPRDHRERRRRSARRSPRHRRGARTAAASRGGLPRRPIGVLLRGGGSFRTPTTTSSSSRPVRRGSSARSPGRLGAEAVNDALRAARRHANVPRAERLDHTGAPRRRRSVVAVGRAPGAAAQDVKRSS